MAEKAWIGWHDNWADIARAFKEGPDFGLHGTDVGALQDILRDIKEGHKMKDLFYAFDSEARKLTDEGLYRSLRASIIESTTNSSILLGDDFGNISFEPSPCYVIGVDNEQKGVIRGMNLPNMSSEGLTLNIGHGLDPKILAINTMGFSIDDVELINSNVKNYLASIGKNPAERKQSVTRLALKNLGKIGIGRIAKDILKLHVRVDDRL